MGLAVDPASLSKQEAYMRKIFAMMLLVSALGALSNPAPADAAVLETTCLNDSIDSCNSDFGGGAERAIAIRGWCYLIRWTWCYAVG
jgi:hypothetical protein